MARNRSVRKKSDQAVVIDISNLETDYCRTIPCQDKPIVLPEQVRNISLSFGEATVKGRWKAELTC